MRSRKLEDNAEVIHAALEETPDMTLAELCVHLSGARRYGFVLVVVAVLQATWNHAEQKTGHAVEQDRPDVLTKRLDWFEGQLGLDPDRLVFIDETWTATNMTRSHGRCRKGERLRIG